MPDPAPHRGVMMALSYLWLLALVPLLTSHDADVRWHARHGLVLTAAELLLFGAYAAITAMASIAALEAGFLLALAAPLGWAVILALHAIAIVKAINGRRLLVPGISAFADRF
jgi:hypothetical protein